MQLFFRNAADESDAIRVCRLFYKWLHYATIWPPVNTSVYTVSQKTVQNCFCQKFVKCLPNFIIFGTPIAQRIGLC